MKTLIIHCLWIIKLYFTLLGYLFTTTVVYNAETFLNLELDENIRARYANKAKLQFKKWFIKDNRTLITVNNNENWRSRKMHPLSITLKVSKKSYYNIFNLTN